MCQSRLEAAEKGLKEAEQGYLGRVCQWVAGPGKGGENTAKGDNWVVEMGSINKSRTFQLLFHKFEHGFLS